MLRKTLTLIAILVTILSDVSFANSMQIIELNSDKASYQPNENVVISVNISNLNQAAGKKLNYQIFHLDKLVTSGNATLDGNAKAEITWRAPATDFQGYLVKVTYKTLMGIIAVDVSSNWTKFPRYGFLSDFSITDSNSMYAVIERLNRFHINGIQFYDWQDSHSNPLPLVDGTPASSWEDINHRTTYLSTLENYISLAHQKNMMAMNYNLAYGAYATDAQRLQSSAFYTDSQHQNMANYPLPGWESDLYLQNPQDPDWLDYLLAKEQSVFDHLGFDGWHVDQLGSASYFTYNGLKLNLAEAFACMLVVTKPRLNKSLVMNAVDAYGQKEILKTGATDFNYTEVWNTARTYSDLQILLDNNWTNSKFYLGKNQPTVLAAYLNYNKANQKGIFNSPGVILTDASILASGGAHIELGEHLLGKEYFPNNNLSMSEELETTLRNYYDFSVAYENLLRDQYTPSSLSADLGKIPVSLDSLSMPNTVWMFARELPKQKVVHLINLLGVSDTLWRDLDGKRKAPKFKKDLTVNIRSSKKVKSIYYASPDADGLTHQLKFKQTGSKVSLSVPELKYWDMLVLNY